MIEQAIFYFFSSIAVFSAMMVIFSKNPVRAVLFLVLAFVAMAANWLMLEAEFLAISLILVYVGAVMVLFLFVVMMLDVESPELKHKFAQHFPLGILVSAIIVTVLAVAVGHKHFGLEAFHEPAKAASDYSNIQALGELLYTEYLLPFEVAGTLLLVAMIAAIALAFRGKRSKSQKIFDQVDVKKSERLKIIKMKSVS